MKVRRKKQTLQMLIVLLEITACMACISFITVPTHAAIDDDAIMLVNNGAAPNITDGKGGSSEGGLWFGNYQQNSDGNGGFNIDPIKWRVLKNTKGNLFLLSDKNLDGAQFHDKDTTASIVWFNCSLRQWLNSTGSYHDGGFANNAFSIQEKAAILKTEVITENNPEYGTPGGTTTEDKLFLPSIEEVTDSGYGFIDDTARSKVISSDYTRRLNMHYYNTWWLRSPGKSGQHAASVSTLGTIDTSGNPIARVKNAVRPAFHLALDAVILTSAAEGGKPSDDQADLTQTGVNANDEWKLTLLDDGSENAVGDRHKYYKVDLGKSSYDAKTGIVKVSYSGAATGEKEYISAIITDKPITEESAKVKYYGRISASSAADASVTFDTMDKWNPDQGERLYVFNEECNGDYKTDYASKLIEIEFKWIGSGTEEDPYMITDAFGWDALADFVKNDNTTEGVFFKLGEDIAVSQTIGTSTKPFRGVFDGDGHTITFNTVASGPNYAPFSYANSAVFKNLHVEGTIETRYAFTAGIVAIANNNTTIINCRSSMIIHSGVKGEGSHGGLIAKGNVMSEGCVFDGSILGENTTSCSGFLGWDYGESDCINCVFDAASIETSSGTSNFIRNSEATANSYYITTIGQGKDQGKLAHSITADSGVTIDYGQGIEYPVSNIIAYDTGLSYKDVFYAGKGDHISLTMPDPSTTGKKYIASAGKLTGNGTNYTLVMPDEDVIISMIDSEDPAVESFLEDLKQLYDISDDLGEIREQLEKDTLTENEHAILTDRLIELENQVSSLRAVLDSLTDEQQALMNEADLLSLAMAEQQLGTIMTLADSIGKTDAEIAESQAANQNAADTVIKLINELPDPAELDPFNETSFKEAMDQIKSVEKAYSTLSQPQKALVTNLNVLITTAHKARITKAHDLTNAKIVLSRTVFTYTGKAQRPVIKTIKNRVLTAGKDYVTIWSNESSKNAGTYTLTVLGIGNYSGKAKAVYKINKAPNPIKLKSKTLTIKYATLKKKSRNFKRTKAITVSSAQGKVSYKLIGVTKSKFKKYFRVNVKTGKITVKKGLKKGSYKVKVKVKASGNTNYKASRGMTITFKVIVK